MLSDSFLFLKSKEKKTYMYQAVSTFMLKLLKKILVICDLLTYYFYNLLLCCLQCFLDEDKLITAIVKIFLL